MTGETEMSKTIKVAEVRPGLRVLKELWLPSVQAPGRVAEVRPGLRVLKEWIGREQIGKRRCCRGSTRFEGTERSPHSQYHWVQHSCRGSTQFDGTVR